MFIDGWTGVNRGTLQGKTPPAKRTALLLCSTGQNATIRFVGCAYLPSSTFLKGGMVQEEKNEQ